MNLQSRRILFLSIPLLIVLGIVILFATQINRDTSILPSVLINKPAPEFELPPIENIPGDIPGFSRDDLLGHVSVVNVFASWCIPCRQEHTFLVRLGNETDVALYGLNQKDAPEDAIQFLTELGNPFDRIGADRNGRVSIDWGVYGVPETFVINAKGIITYKQIGPLNENTYADGLLPAIEAARTGQSAPAS
ncbi:MAG TPA: DsbE family thiol:disulfide interchange protein [Devosia sp.]|nr:DsbE family thiol:disulfide interchange protein [Devosia sp.]